MPYFSVPLQWLGIRIPQEYGGPGSDFFSAVLVIEEMARTDPSLSAIIDLHNTLISGTMLDFGSEEQKKKYLPKLATSMVSLRY